MSKKQARQKKMRDVEASLIQQASVSKESKPLALTPQIPVTIHGEFPNQYLIVEQPNQSSSRKKVQLTQDNAYKVLLDILMEKAGEIELERQLREEAKNKTRRIKQPDWRIIAQHPQAEIREGLIAAHLTAKGSITVLPTRASQVTATKSSQTLEEMGL